MDLGAGDGRFVLARASARPAELVIAVDASRDSMIETSRRASRGHVTNALFVVSAAEQLPTTLAGRCDLLTIHFPWGTLLDPAAGQQPDLTARLAALLSASGAVRILLASSPRDRNGGRAELDPAAVATAWESTGLCAIAMRPATLDDATAARSSWGKRLLSNPDPARRAWVIELERHAPSNEPRSRIEP